MFCEEIRVFDRGMEQLVAREAHNLEVVGSSPTPATVTVEKSTVFLFLAALNF